MLITVGSNTETAVHLRLPVSFFIVSTVVEQGQCVREKIITEIAVFTVQPFEIKSSRIAVMEESSVRLPVDIYAIIIIGITISFAGKPKMKAIKITPSSPKRWAKGSKNVAQWRKSEISFIKTFAISQITSPAGAATATERPSTNKVLSKTERIITFANCGLR